MASSIVTSAAQQLGALVVGEAKFLYEVSDKIECLQRDLQWMQCFLEDADDRQHKDKVVAIWVAEIRDFAYEAEEIVEKYLHGVSHHRRNGMRNTMKWLSCVLCDALALHDVGSDIDCLRTKIAELTSRMQMFGIQIRGQSENSAYDAAMREQRRTYADIEEDPVGLEENIKEVVDKLVNKNEVKVVGISGMGGLGKSTLAKKVFQNDAVRKYFKNNCVWVYISKQFERKDIYQEILIGLSNFDKVEEKMKKAEGMTKKNEELSDKVDRIKKIREVPDGDLLKEICKVLQEKECLVVLDDLWRHRDWDILQPAFEQLQGSCSKILITTRDNSLVHYVDKNGHPHILDFLREEESWKLFRRVAFSERDNTETKETAGSQDSMRENPTEEEIVTEIKETIGSQDSTRENPTVEEIVTGESSSLEINNVDQTNLQDDDVKTKKKKLGREMLKHCGGLPLAIIALAGLLSTKKTIEEWETVQKNITSYLMSDTVEGSKDKGLAAVLELSFYALPAYLKPCFMYLGMFPEDFEVSTQRLYHLWAAEGLLTSISADGIDEIQGVSLDDIAVSYLNQLVQRSMVHVEKRWPNGRIKSCRLHDVMRDLCLKKCKEVNFLNIIGQGNSDEDPSNQIVSPSTVGRKLRRCAIYLRGPSLHPDSSLNNYPCIRSLLVFPRGDDKARKLLSGNTKEFLSLVRVLDLEGADLRGPSIQFASFIHLRYLSLKGAKLDNFPSRIWDCKYLETLDLRGIENFRVSNKFWKLERLKHLYLPSYMRLKGSKKLILKTNQLQQMETLKNFNPNICNIENLEKMMNLRVFSFSSDWWGAGFLDMKNLDVLLKSPMMTRKRLLNPFCLNIKAEVLNKDPAILTKLPDFSIDGINIEGVIDVPLSDSINAYPQMFPHNSTRVTLAGCQIGEEGFRVLEKLPHLKKLQLWIRAIKVSKMRFSNGGFTQLLRLNLCLLPELEELEVEEGSLPNLQYLRIVGCGNLKMIPEGLPSSIQIVCQPRVKGIENYRTCTHMHS